MLTTLKKKAVKGIQAQITPEKNINFYILISQIR